ncbi:MAG: TIGR02677 family protein [Acidimicrobiaceae bacterium]|nr:TIGR02677 family protein [Acidimicrobiaceae bacterium]MXZ98921.1 TIGR02677 family protein [Acidimicrobiaceae bacterium]MYE76183.1 TIGR02677 family protein [Acidimicrobiaceae bacterium]MYE96805.1 TIGR02677 family protein [Acidimicrobiaceae bacterium]MYH44743.1 TIGR02677 family protein [Acidimicrobiaceae bacterium]
MGRGHARTVTAAVTSTAEFPDSGPADRARQLFRYLAAPEWRDYRTILGVFAGTFFAEFSPEEVAAEPAVADGGIDPAVVADRLESLRGWGNLAASSSVGNPSSLEDYYRRRNRYLITRAGQEVFQIVEGVLSGVDEIADVQAGRLRDLDRALHELGAAAESLEATSTEDLAGKVRSVFDVHELFTTELTQFFADLNQWQSRYDLNADEVHLFAGVLVTYVSEQLAEIQRMTRPIARRLDAILPRLPPLLDRLSHGLAARVDDAGLADSVSVRRLPGSSRRDWDHLAEWFTAPTGRAARLDQLTRQAVAAVRALTANVTRLSRAGLGTASKRSDFLRLARFFDQSTTPDEAHQIAAAAFGLVSCRRLGALSADADDPDPSTTSWRDARGAVVPVSLRERGDTTARGRPTPVRDRRRERERIRLQRECSRAATEATVAEVLSCADTQGRIDGVEMSAAGFLMLRDLISRSRQAGDVHADVRTVTEYGVRCTVHRVEGASTVVKCPEGQFVMRGLVVFLTGVEEGAQATSDRPAREADTAVRHQTEAPEDMVMTGAAT